MEEQPAPVAGDRDVLPVREAQQDAARAGVRADDELEKRATWSPPTTEQVKVQVDQWLASKNVDELTKFKVEALWPQALAMFAATSS